MASFKSRSDKEVHQPTNKLDTSTPPNRIKPSFEEIYMMNQSAEDLEQHQREFQALLEYELHQLEVERKYFDPRSAKVPKGHSMLDYALRAGVSVKGMKRHWRSVEEEIKRKK